MTTADASCRDLPVMRARPIPDTGPPLLSAQEIAEAFDPPTSRYVQGTLAVRFDDDADDARLFGRQPTVASELPDPVDWARHIAQAVVEAAAGLRPAPQLIRWLSPEVYHTVAARHAASLRHSRPAGRRALVRSVRTCVPADSVVEACAVVLDGRRARAVALRMEGLDGRWIVTALHIG